MPDTPIVIEGLVSPGEFEDGRQAMICDIFDPVMRGGSSGDTEDSGFFVKLQSWSENRDHTTLQRIAGRRVRVTVAILD